VIDRTRKDKVAGRRRAVELAMTEEEIAKLTVIAHSGSQGAPTITPEAKVWLVSVAYDKAKDHGDPHGRRGCWRAMPARTRGLRDTNVSPTRSMAENSRLS
jgi:hypothetical protein